LHVSYLLALELLDSHLFFVSLSSGGELWRVGMKGSVVRRILDGAHVSTSAHTSDAAAPYAVA
jgi:hypothetical protein